MRKIITFLGTASARPTIYSYQGTNYSGNVFAEALRQFSDYDVMLVCVTKAAAQKNGRFWKYWVTRAFNQLISQPAETLPKCGKPSKLLPHTLKKAIASSLISLMACDRSSHARQC